METTLEDRPRQRSVTMRLADDERRRIVAMAAVVATLHLLGWGGLVLFSGSGAGASSRGALGIGLRATAYTLGMRHAFDADHIAVIDNTTRKLMADGKHPVTVGFWFSLGHSSVVLLLCCLLAFGMRHLLVDLTGAGGVATAASRVFSTAATVASGVFLLVIAVMNLVVLLRVAGLHRRLQAGEDVTEALDGQLDRRGFVMRLPGAASRTVTRPTQMYPLGFLLGLGFDTASEVVLLAMAGSTGASAMPWYAILVLPVLFVAGMSLLDAADGCFMNFAYGWALSGTRSKVRYNMVVTTASVVVALLVGTVELVGVLGDRVGALAVLGRFDLSNLGYLVVALFLVLWTVVAVRWRRSR